VYDVTSASLHAALRGLSARREATAGNIANVETGGYLAQTVDFESALAGALDRARQDLTGPVRRPGGRQAVESAVRGTAPELGTSTAATRLNGNNVNLDDEMVSQERTELAYQTVLEGMNAKFRLLRTAIDGRG
jgi:flagellar basal-body rod protein FlgB